MNTTVKEMLEKITDAKAVLVVLQQRLDSGEHIDEEAIKGLSRITEKAIFDLIEAIEAAEQEGETE